MSDKQRAITHGETYCPACDRIFDGERCPNCNTLLMRVRLGATGGVAALANGSLRLMRAASPGPAKLPTAPAARRWPWIVGILASLAAAGIGFVMLL